jgi:hypothetical protein
MKTPYGPINSTIQTCSNKPQGLKGYNGKEKFTFRQHDSINNKSKPSTDLPDVSREQSGLRNIYPMTSFSRGERSGCVLEM